MSRGELTDAQWERLRALLPPQKPKTGRPARNHRTAINGILWVARTGAPWRDLPVRYDPWAMVASLITVGERHEAVVFEQLIEQGAIKRAVEADPGYVRGV